MSAAKVARMSAGTYEDGGGLRLVVSAEGSKAWVLRTTIGGRRRNMGLGGYPEVSLQEARQRAETHRRQVRAGVDPIEERRRERQRNVTFKQAFEDYFETKKKTLKNGKHVGQWTSTMETYVFPRLGASAIDEVTAADIIAVLRPIWHDKKETAQRVLQRLNMVFAAAKVLNQRRDNPCDGVGNYLGDQMKRVRHFRSLPHAEVNGFLRDLARSKLWPVTKLAFEFLILTATRSGETRGALWSEVDLAQRMWTIPPERLKTGRKRTEPHVVPLSVRCCEILAEVKRLEPDSDLVFPSGDGEAYSDMVFMKVLRDLGYAERATAHGFRASFKTWCAEHDRIEDEVSEVALAHSDGNKVRSAYQRGRFFKLRVGLMQRWSEYVHGAATPKGAGLLAMLTEEGGENASLLAAVLARSGMVTGLVGDRNPGATQAADAIRG